MQRNEIIRAYGKDYAAITKSVLVSAELASEIGDRNSRVLIKPNVLAPTPADFGGTTHTEVVRALIGYLLENGFNNITIAEGSWVGDLTTESFEICGYNRIKEDYGINLIDTQKDKSHKGMYGGMELSICDCVKNADFIINVPVLKGHCQTKVTCALKNMKGLIPNFEKRRFHTIGLHKPIAHLGLAIRQDFILVDHICGDLDFEEGGNPVQRDCVMAAKDPVLVDAFAAHLIGYEPGEVEYVEIAEKLGIGSANLKNLVMRTIEGDDSKDVPLKEHMLSVSYAVDEIDSCSACYASLVPALDRLRQEGLLDKLDTQIAIGQGHKGRSGKLGVGACTSSYEVNVPGCPPDTEVIYETIRKYLKGEKANG